VIQAATEGQVGRKESITRDELPSLDTKADNEAAWKSRSETLR
jgi:hypothetical protein